MNNLSNRSLVFANILISIGIYSGLMWLIYQFDLESVPDDALLWLPSFNAFCNALSASCVITGIVRISKGQKKAHAIAMIAATAASGLFLIGYLTHHAIHDDTRFLTEGWLRPVYFVLLISHILAAFVALPLILITLSVAALKRFDFHKRIARWTYPLWIYVSVTGVVVFVFLRFLNTETA